MIAAATSCVTYWRHWRVCRTSRARSPRSRTLSPGHDGGSPACSAASGICAPPGSPADARIASSTRVTRTRAAGRSGWTPSRPTLYAPHHVDNEGAGYRAQRVCNRGYGNRRAPRPTIAATRHPSRMQKLILSRADLRWPLTAAAHAAIKSKSSRPDDEACSASRAVRQRRAYTGSAMIASSPRRLIARPVGASAPSGKQSCDPAGGRHQTIGCGAQSDHAGVPPPHRIRGIAVTPSPEAARSRSRGKGGAMVGAGPGSLARHRLAPRRREITFGRRRHRRFVAHRDDRPPRMRSSRGWRGSTSPGRWV